MNDKPDGDLVIPSHVNQSSASAQGDMAAGNIDKSSRTYNFAERRSQIDIWMEKLKDEMENNEHVTEFVESLQYYMEKFVPDGIEGLENKLDHAGRSDQKILALRKKERFEKLLEKFSHYASAQEVFTLVLSHIDYLFEVEITPHISKMDRHEIDKAIKEKVVDPAFSAFTGGEFLLDYNHFNGMVFWLAEQCFVRWHK